MTDRASVCILVVEDSPTQAAALAILLESAGYRTLVARRAERALEMLESETVHLVLSDVVMPGMDGYELCRRIRAVAAWSDIRVVLLTSLTDPLAIVRGLASGAEHYVTKPYEPQALLARVQSVVDRARKPAIVSRPFNVELLGTAFTITATKEQILELLVSSYSDLVHTSEAVRDAEHRAHFLAEVTELLSSSLDVGQVLRDLAGLMVPRIADVCAVDFLAADGTPQRTELKHSFRLSPATQDLPRLGAPAALSAPATRALASRAITIVRDADRDVLLAITTDARIRAELAAAGPMSLAVIPLVARDRVLALLHCVAPSTGPLTSAHTLLLLEDVARRAALALENASLYEEARLATRARDDVLAIVSHDLRNPINTIQLSATFLLDLVEEGDANPPYEPQLHIIRRSTRRANALIQDLLDVSRIDARTLAVATVPTSGDAIVADAALELGPLVTGSGVRFEHTWVGPPAEVGADRSRILQAFSNLVGNALKFTPKGGLITIAGHATNGGAKFEVRDTGSGISAAHMPHLFDRFWKATQASRSGAGLGLSIVRGIVESHGGHVEVTSEPGEGTCFGFTIPAPGVA